MPQKDVWRLPAQKPATAALQAKFSEATAAHQQGKLADAERIYGDILQQQPNHFDALHRLGVIAAQTGRTDRAAELFRRAIKLNATVAAVHRNLGIALLELKRHKDALVAYDRAIALKPDYAECHNSRGLALQELKRPAEALAAYDKAIALKPDFSEAYYNRGLALQDLKRPVEALAAYERAIALKPFFAEAHTNRGNILQDLRDLEQALASHDRAITFKPDFPEAYSNRSNALMYLMRPAEALVSCDKAIALKPDFPEAYNNRGNILQDLRRFEEALAAYDKSIALKPDYVEAHNNKSLLLLLIGRFEQGWRQHEWRKKRRDPIAADSFPQPLWLGEENITGKTLFIWCEQGFGDTIQFCRYGKLLEGRGAKVIMSVQQPLLALLKHSTTIEVIDSRDNAIDFDYHCPLMSLPLAFGTTLETIPARAPYIKADEELRAAWAARLPPKVKPRIGVIWSGSTTHNIYNRSVPLETFLALLSPEADWICLQKEISEKDVSLLRQDGRIAFFGDDLRDFSDTAALLDLMDLVITIDTSVAHLAGAMGKPVWILLPYSADWRWLLDRTDSPWYPSVRLFREREIGNWAVLIEEVKSELQPIIG
jgi:tetratricopeptide (TPR) repeat protein